MFHLAKKRQFAKNITALFGEVTRTASKKGLLWNVNSKNKSLRKIVHFENGSQWYNIIDIYTTPGISRKCDTSQKNRILPKKRHFDQKNQKNCKAPCTFLSKWRVGVALMWQIDAFEIKHFKNG